MYCKDIKHPEEQAATIKNQISHIETLYWKLSKLLFTRRIDKSMKIAAIVEYKIVRKNIVTTLQILPFCVFNQLLIVIVLYVKYNYIFDFKKSVKFKIIKYEL